MISTSERINHAPLFNKKRLSSFLDRRCPARKADVPLKKTKAGAQKCVIQRVKNKITVVFAIFSGEGPGKCKKSRTWSSVMMIMIRAPDDVDGMDAYFHLCW